MAEVKGKERGGLWPLAPIDEWVYDIKPGIDNVSVYAAYYYKDIDPSEWGTTDIMFIRDGEWWIDDSLKGGEAEKLGPEYAVLAWFPLPIYPMDCNDDEEVTLLKDGTIIDKATGVVVNHLP